MARTLGNSTAVRCPGRFATAHDALKTNGTFYGLSDRRTHAGTSQSRVVAHDRDRSIADALLGNS